MNIPALNTTAGASVPLAHNASANAAAATVVAGGAKPEGQRVTPPSAAQETGPSREQLESAVKAANDFVNGINNSIQFSLDKETGTPVIKVVDKVTKEVVRQIPSEEMLTIAKALDTVKGLLLHQKA